MDQPTPQEDSSENQGSSNITEIEAVPQQTSSDAIKIEAVPQTVLTGNLFLRVREYVLPSLAVLAVAGSVGYLASREFQTDRSIIVEKPIKSSSLEEKTYVTINDTHFMVDERVGKNLSDLEKESNELLEKAYEVKKTNVDSKYKEMTEKVADETKKAWGLEEPVKKAEEPIEKTNYHENIKKLNEEYRHIADKNYKHINGKK